MAIEAASIRVTAEADVSDASRQLDALGQKVDTTARRMDAAGESGAQTGRKIAAGMSPANQAMDSFVDRLSPVPLGFAGIGVAAAGATLAVGKFGADSIAAFTQFEQQMAQVFTLLPNASEQAMGEMTADVRQFALDFGVSTEQVTQGLYDALSAGVPPGNVFEFLETAQKAATAGMTSLSTTVAGVSSVVNAFGADVITAAEASDIMFQTVNVGQTTFEELSRNVADVTPLAAALGVSFEDVGAALATMTAQGTRTTVATTQLRAMLVELSTAGTEAAEAFEQVAGVSFQTFIDQGGSVAEAMAIVEEAAARSGIPVQQLFGSIEAGLGALTLSGGNLGTFTENVELMGNAAGSTEDAYATMADTGAQSLRDLSAAWNDLKLTVGEGLAPAVQGLADALNALPVSKTISILLDITVPGASDNDVAAFLADALSGLDDIQRAGEVYTVLTGGQRDYNDAVEEGVALQHEQAGAFQQYIDDYLAGSGYAITNQQELNTAAEQYFFAQQQLADAEEARREIIAGLADDAREMASAVKLSEASVAAQERASASLNVVRREGLNITRQYSDAENVASLAAARTEMAVSALNVTLARNAGIHAELDVAMGMFATQGGEYQNTLGSLESAYDALQEKQAAGLELTEQDQLFLDRYPELHARLEGGIQDATIQEGLAAAAKTEVMLAQDALNEAIKRGEEDLGPYQERLKGAQDLLNSADPDSAFHQTMTTLNDTLSGGLIPLLENLMGLIDELDGKTARPDIGVDTQQAEEDIGGVDATLNNFADGSYRAALEADRTQAEQTTQQQRDDVTDYAGGSYRATLEADNSPAAQATRQQVDDVTAYASGTYRATLEAETSAAETQVWNLRGVIGGVPASFTVYAYADVSAAVAQIEGLGALIPHSPAEEGPFSELPNWDWVFEGIGTAAEQYTGEALEHLKTYVDTARAIYDTLGAGLDVGAALAGGGVLPSDEAIATLRDRAQYAVSIIREVAAQFSTEGLDAAKAFAETGRQVFDLFGSVFDAFAGDEWAIPDDATISRMKFAVEHAVRSIMDTALVMDSEGVLAAGIFSSSADVVMGMLGTALDAFAGFADLDMPSDADISRLKFAVEHAVESIRWTAAQFDEEGLSAAASFSTAAQAVMEMLGAALDVFAAESWDIASDAQISRLKFAAEHAVRSIEDTANTFSDEGLAAAQTFSIASRDVMEFLSAAVETFNALGDVDPDTVFEDQVYAVVSIASMVVEAVDRAKDVLDPDGLQTASEFAQTADAIMEFLTSAIDVFVGLGDIDPESVTAAQLDAVVAIATEAVRAVNAALDALDPAGYQQATDFANAAGAVTDMLVSGVTAFGELADVEVGIDVTAAVQTIVSLTEEAVAAIITATSDMQGSLTDAEDFASAGGAVLDMIGGGVQALADLGDAEFVESVDQGLDEFLELVERITKKVALVGDEMGDMTQAAEDYASAAKAVVDLLAAGSADFDGLAGFASSVRRNIDGFFDGIALAVDKLLELGVELDTGLDEAAEIAAKVNEIIELLGGSPGGSGGGGAGGSGGGGGGGSSPLVPGWPVVRGGSGLQPQLSPPEFEDWLSEMVGINASLEQIGDAIEQQVGDLEQTQLDEQLALLQEVFANPENFPAVMLDHVLAAFKQGLGDAGVDQQDVYDSINQALIDAGIEPLSPEDFAEWGESWEQQYAEKMDELLSGVKGGALTMQAAVDRVTQTLLSSDVLFPDGGLDWRSAPLGASKGAPPIIEEEPEPEPATTFNPPAANGGLALAAAPTLILRIGDRDFTAYIETLGSGQLRSLLPATGDW